MAFQIGEGTEEGPLADINVTPLVDVMLVLLIIFMVATPMLHQGIEVDLPEVQASTLPLRTEDPMVLTVTTDELVYIKDDPVQPSQLAERLVPLMAEREGETVFVKGDKNVRFGLVLEVIQTVNDAGIYKVGLVTQPADDRR
ncbi:MAG: ExbD/TolR family protein [Acidobacteriota bacterium]